MEGEEAVDGGVGVGAPAGDVLCGGGWGRGGGGWGGGGAGVVGLVDGEGGEEVAVGVECGVDEGGVAPFGD